MSGASCFADSRALAMESSPELRMEQEFVIHNGRRVIKGWPEMIEAAQSQTTVSIGGVEWRRVPYGAESFDWGADHQPCHDCAVVKGQLHVLTCDVEQCPACGGQALSCDCLYDDDSEE